MVKYLARILALCYYCKIAIFVSGDCESEICTINESHPIGYESQLGYDSIQQSVGLSSGQYLAEMELIAGDSRVRCSREALKVSLDPLYAHGGLSKMFSTIPERVEAYEYTTVMSTSPWIVTIDNFLSDSQVDAFKDVLEEIIEGGKKDQSGGRLNAGCFADCESYPVVQLLSRKLEHLTNISRHYRRVIQVIRYEEGQYILPHHDYHAQEALLPCGPRMLTFMLYLTDVEEGGETGFPVLGIEVKAKKGRALLWPSVLDENPEEKDPRTRHESKVVTRGRKDAVITFFHQYEYLVPAQQGCAQANYNFGSQTKRS